jgi:hypothetical protein
MVNIDTNGTTTNQTITASSAAVDLGHKGPAGMLATA